MGSSCYEHKVPIATLEPNRATGLIDCLGASEADKLAPCVPNAFVPTRCRRCATNDALLAVTAFARDEAETLWTPMNPDVTRSVYATDGRAAGLLEGDTIQPCRRDVLFSTRYGPLPLSHRYAEGSWKVLNEAYDDRTPPVENLRSPIVIMSAVHAQPVLPEEQSPAQLESKL